MKELDKTVNKFYKEIEETTEKLRKGKEEMISFYELLGKINDGTHYNAKKEWDALYILKDLAKNKLKEEL